MTGPAESAVYLVPTSRLMDLERWERVKELFEAALEREEPERAHFLIQACQNDEELRLEVESLLSGEKNAGDFMRPPVVRLPATQTASDHPLGRFFPGQIISGRFNVLRFIGHGGMGEVYEAKDLELGERVALKTIRPEIASDPRTMARFKQEIQLARRVTHPNVCRMFDLERHQPSPETGPSAGVVTFLTMELLEGETLAARIARVGCIATADALPLVQQMAAALAAAHDVGVVHRDFKPGNVMLAPSKSGDGKERAVVTDFGLAKEIVAIHQSSGEGPTSSVTASGHVVGTIAYMAPEQLQGREATPASDIYALGLVMYEMVAARRPFADNALFGGAYQRITQPPPSPRVHVPDLDLRWESAIMRCLEVDPDKRFANTRTLIVALKGEAQASPVNLLPLAPLAVGSGTLSFLPAWTRAVPRKELLAAAALAFVVCAALLVWYLRVRWWDGKPQVPEGAAVLLTDIVNVTGDQELGGVTEVLRSALGQSAHFNLMDKSRVCEILQRMTKPCGSQLDPKDAREVAMRDDVRRVIFGTVSRVADDYKLDLKIEEPDKSDPSHARHSWPFSEAASSKKELFDIIRDGSNWIRQEVGEEAGEVRENDRPPQDITTDSWQALGYFRDAQNVLSKAESNPQAVDQARQEAVMFLRQAVQTDPSFAMAYMRLGDVLDSMRRYQEGYESWQRAVTVQGSRRLAERERLQIQGMYALDMGDFEEAAKSYATYAAHFPLDYQGFFYQAYPLLRLGQGE